MEPIQTRAPHRAGALRPRPGPPTHRDGAAACARGAAKAAPTPSSLTSPRRWCASPTLQASRLFSPGPAARRLSDSRVGRGRPLDPHRRSTQRPRRLPRRRAALRFGRDRLCPAHDQCDAVIESRVWQLHRNAIDALRTRLHPLSFRLMEWSVRNSCGSFAFAMPAVLRTDRRRAAGESELKPQPLNRARAHRGRRADPAGDSVHCARSAPSA